MSTEIVPVRKFRKQIPDTHRGSLDTRLRWLWNQRMGTVQMVWKDSPDVLDHTAATLLLQAIMGKDLESITQVLNRLEGAALDDDVVLARQDAEAPIRV